MRVFRTATVFTMTGRTTRMSHNKVSSFERNGSGEVPPLIDTIVSIKLQNDSIGSQTLQELVLKKSLNYRVFARKHDIFQRAWRDLKTNPALSAFLFFLSQTLSCKQLTTIRSAEYWQFAKTVPNWSSSYYSGSPQTQAFGRRRRIDPANQHRPRAPSSAVAIAPLGFRQQLDGRHHRFGISILQIEVMLNHLAVSVA